MKSKTTATPGWRREEHSMSGRSTSRALAPLKEERKVRWEKREEKLDNGNVPSNSAMLLPSYRSTFDGFVHSFSGSAQHSPNVPLIMHRIVSGKH